MFDLNDVEFLSADSHRNGSGGTPFYEGTILVKEGDMLAGHIFQIIAVNYNDEERGWPDFTNPSTGTQDVFIISLSQSPESKSSHGSAGFRGDAFIELAREIVRQVEERL